LLRTKSEEKLPARKPRMSPLKEISRDTSSLSSRRMGKKFSKPAEVRKCIKPSS